MQPTARRRSPLWAAVLTIAIAGIGACGGAVATAPSPSPSRAQLETLMVDGQPRSYLLFRPAAAHLPAPLVIAMHGCACGESPLARDAKSLENRSRYDALAAQQGFVVVYPEGVDTSWDAGVCCGGSDTDVTFIKDLIAKLVGDGSTDSRRVFVTGVSNGAEMAQRLGCELAGQITAIASVSGTLGVYPCSPARAVSILEMHGTADILIPYEGAGTEVGLAPIMTVMQGWAARDGCPTASIESDSGITKTYTWAPCRDGSTVVLEAIVGGAHGWFGPDLLRGEPSATEVTWSFFRNAPPLT